MDILKHIKLLMNLKKLICAFKIFNGCLNVYTKDKDLHKLTLSAILVFINKRLSFWESLSYLLLVNAVAVAIDCDDDGEVVDF